MAGENKFYLTKEGLEKIKKEYLELKKIRLSKEDGNLPPILHSEDLNPEYLTYQEDMGFLDGKLAELENVIKNSVLISLPPKETQNIVNLGATVGVELDGEIDEFTILGTLEADPLNKRISNESPIGQALLGKKINDVVVVKTPIVNHSCKIVKIKYNIS